MLALRRLEPQLAGADSAHGVAVVGQYAELAVGGGHHQRHAFAPVERDAGRQNIQMERGRHHMPPFFSCSALRITSSMVQALKKAASGYSSMLPDRISLKPRSVSCSGTNTPGAPLNFSAT